MQLRVPMRIVAAVAVLALAGAAPAHAVRDTDFAVQLHGFGSYGQRDFNAWLIKITSKRLSIGAGRARQILRREHRRPEGVGVHTNYPRGDQSVWDWPVAR